MFRGALAFFFRDLWVASAGCEEEDGSLGGLRRELKEVMNSKACGESPNRFLRCSAAASLDRLDTYSMICLRESWSSGSRCESWVMAHVGEDIVVDKYRVKLNDDF